MPDQLQLRGGTTTEHNSFTGASKEVTVDTTKKTLVVHDGATQGGIPLMKESGGNAATTVGIGTGGTNAINIDSSQKVGIGTASPATKLHVENSSGDAFLRLTGSTNYGVSYRRSSDNAQIGYTGNGGAVNLGAANLGLSASQASGNIVFQTGGTAANNERMRVTSAGNVGIGTTSPARPLDVNGGVRLGNDDVIEFGGVSTAIYGSSSSNVLFFKTSSAEKMRLTSDGKLGIGTTSPTRTLDVNGGIRADGTSSFFAIGGNSSTPSEGVAIHRPATSTMAFVTDSTERVRINSSGNVGIGTTSPAQKLHVQSTGDTIVRVTSADGSAAFLDLGDASDPDGGRIHYDSGSNLVFNTASSERMRINSSGRVGIGTTDPSTGQLVVYRATVNAANPIIQARSNHDTTNSVKFEIDGDGDAYFSDRVGIGTLSPGSFNTNADDIVINRSANAGITISTPNSNVGRIAFGDPEDNNVGQVRYSHSDNAMLFDVNVDERMRIDSAGRVRIGNTDLTSNSSADNLVIGTTSGHHGLTIFSGTDSVGNIFFADTSTSAVGNRMGTITYDHATNYMRFSTSGNQERMRIDSGGRILFNMTAPLDTIAGSLNISGGTSGGRIAMQGTTTSAGAGLAEWFSHWDTNKVAGFIARSGTDTTNKDEGELAFFTRGSNGALGERLTIDQEGAIGIGTANPGAMLELYCSNNTVTDPLSANNRLRFRDNDSTGTGGQPLGTIEWYTNDGNNEGISAYITSKHGGTSGEGEIFFGTGTAGSATDKMKLLHNGELLVGKVNTSNGSPGFMIDAAGKRVNVHRDDSDSHLFLNKTGSNTGTVATFAVATSTKGTISISSTATAYNTSSDYRLKENVVSISDGITRLKTLKPSRFNFKTDASTTVDGFLAHEVSSIVPEAITGEKDAVDSEGNIDPQQIDQSKLVPLLTAALQEAISKIETLEAKVAALEAA